MTYDILEHGAGIYTWYHSVVFDRLNIITVFGEFQTESLYKENYADREINNDFIPGFSAISLVKLDLYKNR